MLLRFEVAIDDPDIVGFAIEEWRLYPHTAQAMIGKTFPEVRLIGAMEYMAQRAEKPIVFVKASQQKTFFSHLKRRDLRGVSTRHELDAVRIGLHALLFKCGLPAKHRRAILTKYKGVKA